MIAVADLESFCWSVVKSRWRFIFDSWQRLNQGLDTGVVQVLTFSPNGQYLFAGTEGHGIFRLK